jgi:hypothetical protein
MLTWNAIFTTLKVELSDRSRIKFRLIEGFAHTGYHKGEVPVNICDDVFSLVISYVSGGHD